jgi:hypothetical protein
VIIRILNDGQFELDDAAVAALDPLDSGLEKAIAGDDEAVYAKALTALIDAVHASGSRLDPATILPSDLAVPPADSTLAEARAFLESGATADA